MFIKTSTIFVLVIASCLSTPDISVEVTKTNWFFVKWVNFSTNIARGSTPTTPDVTQTISKWYMFADYYGKLATETLKVAVFYKINDSKDYASVAVRPVAQQETVAIIGQSANQQKVASEKSKPVAITDKIIYTPSLSLATVCKDNEKVKYSMEKVELVDATFNVYIAVTCESTLMSLISSEVANAVTKQLSKLSGSQQLQGSKKLSGSKLNQSKQAEENRLIL